MAYAEGVSPPSDLFGLSSLYSRRQPVDTLVVYQLPGLSELQIDHAGAIAAVPVRQSQDLFAQR